MPRSCGRADAGGPQVQVRLRRGRTPRPGSAASRTTGARSSRTPSRTAGRSATAVPAPPTASQTDVAPFARSVRMASRATVGSGSACQDRTSQPSGTAPRGPVAPHERPPPGHADVRQLGDVGRGVERPHRDAVRGRPGQRLDPGRRAARRRRAGFALRSTASTAATQAARSGAGPSTSASTSGSSGALRSSASSTLSTLRRVHLSDPAPGVHAPPHPGGRRPRRR